MTSSGTVDWTQSGTYYVDYNYTDSMSTSAMTVTKIVIVADRTPPVVQLVGSGVVNINLNTIYVDAGATWTDLGFSGSIIASGTVDTGVVGTNILTYYHVDAAGNIGSGTRTVNVTTGSLPVITLSGSNPVNLLIGDTYTESGFTISDFEDGDLTLSGSSTGTVNTSIPGIYILTYSVTDSN